MPHEYWNGVPPDLQQRLRKLTEEEEIVEEMRVYAAEEAGLRNREAMLAMGCPPVPISPPPFGQNPQVNIRPEDLPPPWRGRRIPPELQERLASLSTIAQPSVRQMRARDEMKRFFIDQDQRRFALEAVQKRRAALDQQPLMQPPLQIEIVPSSALSAPTLIGQPATPPHLPLTPNPEFETKPQR